MNPPSADGHGSPPIILVSHDSDSIVVHPAEEDDTQSCSVDLDQGYYFLHFLPKGPPPKKMEEFWEEF